MKIQNRTADVYNRIFSDKNSGQEFHMEVYNPSDKVKLVDLARKYRMLLFKLGNQLYWTWIGDRAWYKKTCRNQNYNRAAVLHAVVSTVLDNSKYTGSTIEMLNPTGTIEITWSEDGKFTIVNENQATNRLFTLLKS